MFRHKITYEIQITPRESWKSSGAFLKAGLSQGNQGLGSGLSDWGLFCHGRVARLSQSSLGFRMKSNSCPPYQDAGSDMSKLNSCLDPFRPSGWALLILTKLRVVLSPDQSWILRTELRGCHDPSIKSYPNQLPTCPSLPLRLTASVLIKPRLQSCGSGSGIRCFLPLDPGLENNANPDLGWTSQIIFSGT